MSGKSRVGMAKWKRWLDERNAAYVAAALLKPELAARIIEGPEDIGYDGSRVHTAKVVTTGGDEITLELCVEHRVRLCDRCDRTFAQMYMVRDELWAESGFDKNEVACIHCLQAALSRPLMLDDFKDVRLNEVLLLVRDNMRRVIDDGNAD